MNAQKTRRDAKIFVIGIVCYDSITDISMIMLDLYCEIRGRLFI